MAIPYTQIPISAPRVRGPLTVAVARSAEEVRACQALRYQVFANEMGARIEAEGEVIDRDEFDPHCIHLLVRDRDTGDIAATTRLLLERDADRLGMFYSESEFELGSVLDLQGRLMEVGRTCVAADYRSGSAITLLWSGVAQLLVLHEVDFLMGCVSIPMQHGPNAIRSLIAGLDQKHLLPESMGVVGRTPLPDTDSVATEMEVPGLLRSYLKMGAQVSASPCWDPMFDVADLFVLLGRERITRRYARHFVVNQ